MKKPYTKKQMLIRIFQIFIIILGIGALGLATFYTIRALPKQNSKPYKSKTTSYEVISVYRYVHRTTNQFGGVTKEEVAYHFQYLTKKTNTTYSRSIY